MHVLVCLVYMCGACTGVYTCMRMKAIRPSGVLFYYSIPYPLKAVSLTEGRQQALAI